MDFPVISPGQMVDECIGHTGVYIYLAVGGTTTYTVPAGFTLLVHGMNIGSTASVAGAFTFGGVAISSPSSSGITSMMWADRNRLAPYAINTLSGLAILTNGSVTTQPAALLIAGSGGAAQIISEHAPYLLWPLAAGQTFVLSGSAGIQCVFWGTLVPT